MTQFLLFFLFYFLVSLPIFTTYNIYSLNQSASHTGDTLIQRVNPLVPGCLGEPSAGPFYLIKVPFVTTGLLFKSLE